MKIAELKPKQGSVDITAEVVELSDVREFSKFGRSGRVATAVIKDDTGSVKLTLWNEQVERVSVGDTVHIKNGYVGEWQGDLQLTTGRMGSLEIAPGEKGEKDGQPKKGALVYDLDAKDEE